MSNVVYYRNIKLLQIFTCLNVTLDDCIYGELVQGITCMSLISKFSNLLAEAAILKP